MCGSDTCSDACSSGCCDRSASLPASKGEGDRSLLKANCNDYDDKTTLGDYRSSLVPLGTIGSATPG